MRIALISLQQNSDIIGAKYLHALLRSQGHDSSILLIPNQTPENLQAAAQWLETKDPQILGFSIMSYEFQAAAAFARSLRPHFAQTPFLFGGIHATVAAEECLQVADVAVRGEAEDTLLELVDLYDKGLEQNLANVAGISLKQNGQVLHTANRPPTLDLDVLPYPKHMPKNMFVAHAGAIHKIQEPAIFKRYARYQGTFLSILSSRGCPYSCTYCCNVLLNKLNPSAKVRKRSPRSVIDELLADLADFPDILYVNLQDDCFMMHNQAWLEEFAQLYHKEIDIPFMAKTTPVLVKEEKLGPLHKAGLRWVNMGLQTGSDRVNRDVYGRKETAQRFVKAAAIIDAMKFSPWYDIILDNPWETEEDHLKTIETLLQIPRPYQVDLYSLDLFPGTLLRERAEAENIPYAKVGEKSYTHPEAKTINRLIRMCPTMPRWLVRSLLRQRSHKAGKIVIQAFYYLTLICEPPIYLFLIHRANNNSMPRTIRVFRAFAKTAINKLFFHKQG